MKFSKNLMPLTSLRAFTFAISIMATCTSYVASAHPYAANIVGTNDPANGPGVASFILNESADSVNIVFDPGQASSWTNALGATPKGLQQFLFPGTNTSFQIICTKQGTGTPTLITTDTDTNANWPNGSGVALNKNPAIGPYFGRVYANNNIAGGTAPSNKLVGIYAMNADLSSVFTNGTLRMFNPTPPGSNWTGSINGNFKSPNRMRVAPDNSLLVADGRGVNDFNQVYMFHPDLTNNVALLGPSTATGAGDQFGTPVAYGSLAAGNLVLYTAQAGTATPNPAFNSEFTNCIRGPNTGPGDFNCVFRYNIGSGPLPWNKRPDWAYTVGLNGIAQLRPEVDVTPDGKIYAGFGRGNLSNPDIQILAPAITTNSPIALALTNNVDRILALSQSPTNWLYTSGVVPPNNQPPVSDPWNGSSAGSGGVGTYAGVRVSPDGQFLASVDIFNAITLATLTNGVPDDGSIFGIQNLPQNGGNSRGMDWDAALNIWVMSSAQGLVRCYSLGLTTTCVTSNDWTGTNGSFAFTLPGATASVVATTPTGSQNYTNNISNPGDSTPAVFTISLNQSTLAAPVAVSFVRSGTAVYGVNYQMLTNLANVGGYFTNADGVAMNTNTVIFPAGVWPHAGNWSVALSIKPTSTPVSGPTTTVGLRLLSGATYSAKAPVNGTVAILNTGPQLLQLSAAAPATAGNMNRGIPNDSARFTLTRLGDTNGPGNDSITVTPTSYTVTNVTYLGTGQYPLDYTARAQKFTGALPIDTTTNGILIPPGPVTFTGLIGNPVKHTDTSIKATNLTIIINLTNSAANPGTNLLSAEGKAYQVNQAVLTLNEFDNAVGGEVVLWSNPLTNSFDSTNWTAVFANVNLSPSPVLPTVISNYDNSRSSVGSEGFIAAFGKSVNDAGNDGGVAVPPSDTMTANGWTTALKVSVNKNPANAGEAGINLYPASGTNQGTAFHGNYALRFDMYLSLYNASLAAANTANREFAAFGINHRATNANWRLDSNPRPGGTGSFPINGDGEWASINAGINSITPADWDLFIPTAFSQPIYDQSKFNTNQQAVPYQGDYDKVQSVIMTNLGTGYASVRPAVVFSGGGGAGAAGTAVTNSAGQVTSVTITAAGSGYTSIPAVSLTGGSGANAGGFVLMGGHFVINALTNAVQSSPGVYTGVTNAWGNAAPLDDIQSLNNNAFGGTVANGIIKSPPFGGITNNPNGQSVGGAPVGKWVDVSFEVTRQTNIALLVARQEIFHDGLTNGTFGTRNQLAPNDGVPMLGYLDPNSDLSFNNAFVYYSNIRIVELSPFIPWTNQPVAGLIVTQGASFSLASAAIYASNPLTNTWYEGTTNGPAPVLNRNNGTPTNSLATNIFAATNGSSTLAVANIQTGTNYLASWSDQAGSVTGYLSVVEVVSVASKAVPSGVTTNLAVVATGNSPPTGFQWKRSGTNLVNGTQASRLSSFGGVTTATLTITNAQSVDTGVYSNLVVNAFGNVNVAGTLTVSNAPTSVVVSPAATNAPWGSPVKFTVSAAGDPPFTYQWKKGGNNIAGATDSSFTIGAVTTTDGGAGNSYTAGVTNAIGGALSSAGVLTVSVPAPTISSSSVSGGIVTLNFTSTNPFDTSSAFILQSCGFILAAPATTPFTNAQPSGTFSGTAPNFQVTTPQTGDTLFYRLLHVP